MISLKKGETLIQEDYQYDVWKSMVCCLMLNQTSRKQLDKMINGFFELYPTPERFIACDKSVVLELIRPLGLFNRRFDSLLKFSIDFLTKFKNTGDISSCFGIGKYAENCYRLLHLKDLSVEPTDKELKKLKQRKLYVENA